MSSITRYGLVQVASERAIMVTLMVLTISPPHLNMLMYTTAAILKIAKKHLAPTQLVTKVSNSWYSHKTMTRSVTVCLGKGHRPCSVLKCRN